MAATAAVPVANISNAATTRITVPIPLILFRVVLRFSSAIAQPLHGLGIPSALDRDL